MPSATVPPAALVCVVPPFTQIVSPARIRLELVTAPQAPVGLAHAVFAAFRVPGSVHQGPFVPAPILTVPAQASEQSVAPSAVQVARAPQDPGPAVKQV